MTNFYLTFVKDVKSESRLIILPGCSFPLVTVTNYHKLSGLKLQKFISLQFLSREYNMHFGGAVTSRDSNRKSFPCVSSFRRTPEFLGSQLLPPSSKLPRAGQVPLRFHVSDPFSEFMGLYQAHPDNPG